MTLPCNFRQIGDIAKRLAHSSPYSGFHVWSNPYAEVDLLTIRILRSLRSGRTVMYSPLSGFALRSAYPHNQQFDCHNPMNEAQKIRFHTVVLVTQPTMPTSTTIATKSTDVTKTRMVIAIARNNNTEENGKCSRKLNWASATSCWTVFTNSIAQYGS